MNWWEQRDPDYDGNDDEREAVFRAVSGQSGSGWIRVHCPLCEHKTGKADRKGSMGYNTASGGFNCFKCGTTGQLDMDRRVELPFTSAEAAAIIESEPVEIAVGYVPVYDEPGLSSPMCDAARAYLEQRGLKSYDCREARVGVALWGKLAGRVIVPIFDPQDEQQWLGWVARDYTGKAERKYLYPKGMKRADVIYNEPALYYDVETPVFLVEGTLDVLSLWPDAVALLGKPLETQMTKLASSTRPIAVCLDGDAWQEGWALAMKLQVMGRRAGNIRLPPRKDPDEMPRSWLDEEATKCLLR